MRKKEDRVRSSRPHATITIQHTRKEKLPLGTRILLVAAFLFLLFLVAFEGDKMQNYFTGSLVLEGGEKPSSITLFSFFLFLMFYFFISAVVIFNKIVIKKRGEYRHEEKLHTLLREYDSIKNDKGYHHQTKSVEQRIKSINQELERLQRL